MAFCKFTVTKDEMTPVEYAMIAVFVLVVVLVSLIFSKKRDRNANKKFNAQFEKEYRVNDMYGDMILTGNGEILYRLPSGKMAGYKKWNLSEIGYIGTYRRSFAIYDHDRNVMAGEYFTASRRKKLKEYGCKNFEIGSGKDIDGYVDFVMKYSSDVRRIAKAEIAE